MATTQYIGARYVPVFADPPEWSSTKSYEPLTIVLHEGNSYTSRQFVPVGVDIDNDAFWAETGNYNAQIEQYRREVFEYRDYFQHKPFAFDTATDMQRSDELYAGAICYTNGFYASGDGGAACYMVSTSGTDNGRDVLACANNLYAKLVITTPFVTPEQFGAYGNGVHDDTASISAAIAKANIKLTKKYLVSTETANVCIRVPSNRIIEFCGATVNLAANALGTYAIFMLYDVENVKIFGTGTIIGDKDTHTGTTGEWGNCISIYKSKNIQIEGLSIYKAWGDGIYIGSDADSPCENVIVKNCDISQNSRNNISVIALIHGLFENLILNDADRALPKVGIDFEPNNNNVDTIQDVFLNNCTMKGNAGGFSVYLPFGAGNNSVYINDCTVYGNVSFYLRAGNDRVDVNNLRLINVTPSTAESIMMNIFSSNTANLRINGSVYNCNSLTRIVNARTSFNNVALDFDVFGTGIWAACTKEGNFTSRGNTSAIFRYHIPQVTADGGPEALVFDKYSNEFTTVKVSDGATTAPSYGCDYEIVENANHAVFFRANRSQPGTTYIIKNSSPRAQTVGASPFDSLASGHIGIYKSTSIGLINKVLDIDTNQSS